MIDWNERFRRKKKSIFECFYAKLFNINTIHFFFEFREREFAFENFFLLISTRNQIANHLRSISISIWTTMRIRAIFVMIIYRHTHRERREKKKKIIETHDHILNDSNNITIYIDDSDIDNTIEIATIWTIEIKNEKLTRVSIYSKTTLIDAMYKYTIYFKKLYDILMIFELVKTNEYLNDDKSIHIFVDNQTTLFVCHKSKHDSSQYILKKIVKLHRELCVKHSIILHWVFVHINVSNNELTDIMTKKTTSWKKKDFDDAISRFFEFHILISTSMFCVKRWTNKKWIDKWKESKQKRTSFKLCEYFMKRNLDKFKNLKKFQIFVFIQLRIEKINLINYQYKIEKANSKSLQLRRNEKRTTCVIAMFQVSRV